MAKKGREFELLISRLESAAQHVGARVESPYRVLDPSSDTLREIDVAVLAGDGTVLIALECQDRALRAGLAWIEQLITKGQAIGARRIVAVSKGGFTKGAMKRARAAGIETRSIEALSDEDFRLWMPRIEVMPFSLSVSLAELAVAPCDAAQNSMIVGAPALSLNLLLEGHPVTMEEIFRTGVLKHARRLNPDLKRDQVNYNHAMAYVLEGCKDLDSTKVHRFEFSDLVARMPGGDVRLSRIEFVFAIHVGFFEPAERTAGKYVGEDGAIRGFVNVRYTPVGSFPDLGGTTISIAAPPPLTA